VSVTVVAVADPRTTPVPAVTEGGGVLPTARRTTIEARSASVGLVHDSWIDEVVRVPTVSPVIGPGAVVSGAANVEVVVDTDVLVFGTASRANTAYEYCVPTARPVSVTEVAVADARLTPIPAVTEAGGVLPTARRTTIEARSASDGLIHDSWIDVVVRVPTVNPVTGPGAVVSGAVRVPVVTDTGALVFGTASCANTAYEYCVPAAKPVSVTELAVADAKLTPTPAATEAGGVLPTARRTTIEARSASVGLIQDSWIDVVVRVPTVNPVTGAGAVVSGRANVEVVVDAAPLVFGTSSWANTAYEYCVPATRPESVTALAVADPRATPVPAVTEAGGVLPTTRRTTTPVRSASDGLVHDN
jgi:hypothetical protein